MRVVMLCRLYSPHLGGVEKHVLNLSKEILKGGNQVDVFTLPHERKLPSFEVMEGILVHRKPRQLHSRVLKIFFGILPFFPKKLAQNIVERDEIWGWLLWNLPTFLFADVIHIHDVFFWYWPIRILLPWKKVFITFHGFEAGSLPTQKAKKTRRMAAHWTNGNIAVGGWIKKWYGTDADLVTYGAGSCIPEKSTALHTKMKAVFIGRVASDTGAKVYAKIIDSVSNYTLDIYGEGSELGTVENSCALFPQYDLACVSSYLSILEAMQSKVFVLAYATDDLKWDYLQSHPMAHNMCIVRSEAEMKSFLDGFTPEKYHREIERAFDWAKEQTWRALYLQYENLWQK
ncbi:MAG: glycosyltransferase [Candidatus Woesebacteria bacterium]